LLVAFEHVDDALFDRVGVFVILGCLQRLELSFSQKLPLHVVKFVKLSETIKDGELSEKCCAIKIVLLSCHYHKSLSVLHGSLLELFFAALQNFFSDLR
jgi:hypothetical protein